MDLSVDDNMGVDHTELIQELSPTNYSTENEGERGETITTPKVQSDENPHEVKTELRSCTNILQAEQRSKGTVQNISIEGGIKNHGSKYSERASDGNLPSNSDEECDDYLSNSVDQESVVNENEIIPTEVLSQDNIEDPNQSGPSPSSLSMPPNHRKTFFRYYAVRVGYARASYFREDIDGVETQEEIQPRQGATPMVKIRSAIFLYWDDARQFLDEIKNLDEDSSLEFQVEYDSFDSIEEAEAYLLEPETRFAWDYVISMTGESLPRQYSGKILYHQPFPRPTLNNQSPRNHALQKKIPYSRHPHPLHSRPMQRYPLHPHRYPYSRHPYPWRPHHSYRAPVKGRPQPASKLPVKGANEKSEAKPSSKLMLELKAKDKSMTDSKRKRQHLSEMERKKRREECIRHKYDESWNEMFQRLLNFKAKHNGSLDIIFDDKVIAEIENNSTAITASQASHDKEILELREWCDQQSRTHQRWVRGKKIAGSWSQEKCDKLSSAGVDLTRWRMRRCEKKWDLKWEKQYEKVKAYFAANNTLKVKESYDYSLYRWSTRQRRLLQRHLEGKPVTLSEYKLKKLTELGWKMEDVSRRRTPPRINTAADEEAIWNKNYEHLKRYMKENGHMMFSVKDLNHDELLLMRWVERNRREYRKLRNGEESKLTAVRMRKLNDAGFIFNPRDISVNMSFKDRWEARLQSLKDYKERHGDFAFRQEEYKLSRIITKVRVQYKQRQKGIHNGLSDERIAQLEEIGFDFYRGKTPEVREQPRPWEERFEQLLQFKEEHGHCIVPQSAGSLGEWVKKQRAGYKLLMAGKPTNLTHEKALRLSSIGFCFDASSRFKGKIRTVS
mmetsp:Transcript_30720/g.59912  ORF Transcript_30720/g.59912 Transcript_30720/m.59912 type:complete len:841 (+) Transcript_30720:52-2574(+)